jgi:lipopolysaccharide export system permease protein
MWAVQQMSRKNELVPVLVAGISFRRLSVPVLAAGFLLSLLFAGVRESVLPKIAEERHRVERLFKGKANESPSIRPPQIRDAEGRIWHIREYEIATKTARGLNIVVGGLEAKPRRHWEAVRWEGGRWIVVAGDPGDETVLIETKLTPRDIEIESRSLLFLDVGDLRRMINRYPHRSNLRLLLHAHFAYPLGTMVLLLMGLPLVLRAARKTPFVAAGVSLLLSIAFFAVSSVMQDLGGRDEVLNPVLGAWLPIILFGAVGLILFETMRT